MKVRTVALVFAAIGTLALVGCQSAGTSAVGAVDTTAASTPGAAVGNGEFAERPLSDESLLALGTLKLEGTDNAVTPEQAGKLLTFWRLIEGGTLKSTAETTAVVKQIRGQMTAAQVSAIEAMGLTGNDYQAWLQEQGIELPAFVGGQSPTGADDMTEDERAALREQFQNMTEDERATAMADRGQPPAGGAPGGGQRPGGAGGPMGGNAILTSLIELLTERS